MKSKRSLLDEMLQEVRDDIEAGSAVAKNFVEPGDVTNEVARFIGLSDENSCDKREQTSGSSGRPKDYYEEFLDKDEEYRIAQPRQAEQLTKIHESGVKILPDSLYKLLDTLQPTSVPAERIFSRGRHKKRFPQERQADERFEDNVFLGCSLTKSLRKREAEFKAKYDMQKPCKRVFEN